MVSRRKFVHRDSLQIQESKSQISAFYLALIIFMHSIIFWKITAYLALDRKNKGRRTILISWDFFFYFFSRDKYISRLFNMFKKCLTLNCYHLSFHSRTDRKVRTPYSLIRWNSFRSHISFSAKLTSFRNMLTNIGKGFYIAA